MTTHNTREGIEEKIINDPRVKSFWDKIPYTKSKILEHPEGVTIINYLNDSISELIKPTSKLTEEWEKVTWEVLSNVQTGRMSIADAQEKLDKTHHQELQKAREEERERIVKDLRLASLIDAGGDGLVSVKMGMTRIEAVIRGCASHVVPLKESSENLIETFEYLLIKALPDLRELTFHSDGSVIAKSGASARKPKKLYSAHPKRNKNGTNAEPFNWEQLTKKAIKKLITDQSELDKPNK